MHRLCNCITTKTVIIILVYHCYLSSNCTSVIICGIQCVLRYYVIPGLLNGVLITNGQSVHVVYIFLETIHTELEILGICLCCVFCMWCGSSSTGMSLCRIVLVQSCVAVAVSHRESPREGGTKAAGQCWCLCNGP